MKDGFFGNHTSFMLDAVVVALVLIVPVLIYSLISVKFGRHYVRHRNLQMVLAVALLAAVFAFEIDLHLIQGGWENVVRKGRSLSIEQRNFIQRLLRIHLLFAGSTPFLWATTIFCALRWMPNPPQPSAHSRLHKTLGWASTFDLVMTSITGLIFYYFAFINRG